MEGFREWLEYHLTAFGLLAEQHVAAGRLWEPLFDASRLTAGELRAATGWLLLNAPPRWIADHPHALRDRIRAARMIALASAPEEDRAVCTRCGGCGALSVPHLRRVINGEWMDGVTQAVRCSCERGRFGAFTNTRGESLMALEEYERLNPNHAAQVVHRRREQRVWAEYDRTRRPEDVVAEVARRFSIVPGPREPGEDDE